MKTKMTFFSDSKQVALFSRPVPVESRQLFNETLNQLLSTEQNDCTAFQQQSLQFIRKVGDSGVAAEWDAFIRLCTDFSKKKSEQLWLLQMAFRCFYNSFEPGELGQLATLARYLKEDNGLYLLHPFLTVVPPLVKERALSNYIQIFQLLLDLHKEVPKLKERIEEKFPNLSQLLDHLKIIQQEHLRVKYPEGDLDLLVARFGERTELVEFPLPQEELKPLKEDYLAIKSFLSDLQSLPLAELQRQLKEQGAIWKQIKHASAKQKMVAILTEAIRRHYGILPYNTQILSILAFINRPEGIRGRIGQVRTGEGKSTLIAMLTAFAAAQGEYVDIITSSSNLAQRDCEKYLPFFQSLGFSTSWIEYPQVIREDSRFHAQIIFGTHTDFEFVFLCDGLNKNKLRRSLCIDESLGVINTLIDRPYHWVLVDEVDALLLDEALSAAQIAGINPRDIFWIYPPIFHFVQSKPKELISSAEVIQELRALLEKKVELMADKYKKQLANLPEAKLKRWYESAHTALHKKHKDEDYVVKPVKKRRGYVEYEELDVVIVNLDTGRLKEGSQWQHGIHQFLQLKHELSPTAPLRTTASISQSSYFSLYTKGLNCLSGTIGELEERKSFETIYQLDSFAVPPHRIIQRKRLPDFIFRTQKEKWDFLYKQLKLLREQGLPSLILFRTIKESNAFSKFITKGGMDHLVLNETQREIEEIVISRAGDPGAITIATNTAGRGTDIELSPKVKELIDGGLRAIVASFPRNLRVELQAFGRAGRQGQPGACWMVLDLEDNTIQSLLQEAYPNDTTKGKCLLETQGSQGFIQLLYQLRSQKIQQECLRRAESCKQEQFYFSKLQAYFHQLGQVYAVTDTPSFRTTLLALCENPELVNEREPLKLKTAKWLDLKEEALNHQMAALKKHSDWNPFIDKLKETFLDHISNLWAAYYSKLKDPLESEASKEKAYLKLQPYLTESVNIAKVILNQLLTSGYYEKGKELECKSLSPEISSSSNMPVRRLNRGPAH